MIFRDDIIKCYNNYKILNPLDITKKKQYATWLKKYQLNLLSYSRIVWELRDLKTINDIIKSDFDYDNLYIVIESLINTNFLKINNSWDFIWSWLEKNIFKSDSKIVDIFEDPNNDYNQFPCNKDSRIKRVKLFYELFPYVKEMNIWILWDDDLLSIELFKTLSEVIEAIHLYIYYYNNNRIHTALKMTPVQFAKLHS